jgi:flavin-dependent dehydrogenase
MLERGRHPRFHLGESLLPASLDVLREIGVLDEVRARFLAKHGARFVDGTDERRSVRYAFVEAFGARWDHAFQVPRDEFDELLFRRAGACGAELHEGWEVTRVVFESGRAVGVEARTADGVTRGIDVRVVVDASGRDAILARGGGTVERIAHLDRTAIFTQVTGAWRDTDDREGDIQIVVFGVGEQRGWFWLIPFKDGRTSVGVVVSGAWVRSRRDGGGPEALFEAALEQAPTVARMLERARRMFPPRATADFSFRVRALRGDGWVAVGDAAGFIDPLFSTGAHLAMHGALRLADEIDTALGANDVGPERFEAWERHLQSGTELFVGAVQAFYAGDLIEYLFADPQHPFLRRAITSMLSGDVFDEGGKQHRWAREMRARFGVVG